MKPEEFLTPNEAAIVSITRNWKKFQASATGGPDLSVHTDLHDTPEEAMEELTRKLSAFSETSK